MEEKKLKPNGVYKHFNGRFYRVLGVSNNFKQFKGIDFNLSEMVRCGQVVHTENKNLYTVYSFQEKVFQTALLSLTRMVIFGQMIFM